MGVATVASAFERALAAEILASERIRIRTLAATLAVIAVVAEVLFLLFRDSVQSLARGPLPMWLPLHVLGPFILYECVALFGLEQFHRHGGFINKFLGDGFMAVFGAPLEDAHAAQHAVAAARDILAEIPARGLGHGRWPLRVGIGLHVGPAALGEGRGPATPLGELPIKGYEGSVRVWRLQ